jgi:hypothetical protein
VGHLLDDVQLEPERIAPERERRRHPLDDDCDVVDPTEAADSLGDAFGR